VNKYLASILYRVKLLRLPDYDSILVQNQSALERFIREIFGEQGETAGIHLKNMFNVSAPGFFKNLVFLEDRNISPEIVSINNLNLLKAHRNVQQTFFIISN
jgi:hypothetical protein